MASLVKVQTVRYLDSNGKRVSKNTPGARKVVEKSRAWYGQYKDASGKWKRSRLFTDKVASQQRLAVLVASVERGEAGLINPHKQHLDRPVEDHVRDYLAHLETKGVNPKHYSERV